MSDVHHLTLCAAQFLNTQTGRKKKSPLSLSVASSLIQSDIRCCILMCVCVSGGQDEEVLSHYSVPTSWAGARAAAARQMVLSPPAHAHIHTRSHTVKTVRRKSLAGETTRFLIEQGEEEGWGRYHSVGGGVGYPKLSSAEAICHGWSNYTLLSWMKWSVIAHCITEWRAAPVDTHRHVDTNPSPSRTLWLWGMQPWPQEKKSTPWKRTHLSHVPAERRCERCRLDVCRCLLALFYQ